MANPFAAPLSNEPFKPAQQRAQQRVVRTQRALPKTPTPNIPRIANPTPTQTHAALTVAAHSQRQAIGANPSAQRIRSYQQELRQDPRNHEYLNTVQHYARASEAHTAELLGRIHAGGGQGLQSARSPAGAALGTAEAIRIGRALLSAPHATAGRAVPPKGGPGLLDTIGGALSSAGGTALDALHKAYPAGSSSGSGRRVAPGVAAIQPINSQKLLEEGVTGKGTNEVFDLPAQSVLSVATLLAAAKDALPKGQAGSPLAALGGEGNTQPLKQIGGALAHQVTHPVQSFEQAPLATALTFGGIEGGLGGLVGKAGRAAGMDFASTARPDLKLYGEPGPSPLSGAATDAPQVRTSPRGPVRAPRVKPAEPPAEGLRKLQQYNKDPLRKAGQRAYEKALPHLPGDLAQKDPFQAEGWRLKRNLVGGKLKPGRVDYTTTGGEQARRTIVKSIAAKGVGLKPKVGEHAVPLMVDNTIRLGPATTPDTILADLQKRAADLKSVQGELKGSKLKQNKASLDQVEKLLADKAFLKDPSEAMAAARRFKEVQKPLTAMRVLHGSLQQDQLRASLFPYAQTHLGAVHFSPTEHTAAENSARETVTGLGRTTSAAVTDRVQAEAAMAKAKAAEKIRNVIDLANRPGSVGEGDAAAAKIAQLKARAGLKDLREAPSINDAQRRLDAAKTYEAEATRALRTAQGVHLDIAKGSPLGGLRDNLGRPLSNEAIRAHMRANGVEEPGFISHKPGIAGGRSYFQSVRRFPSLERFNRTGSAYRKGTIDHTFEGLVGHLASEASKVAQHEVRANDLKQYVLGSYDSQDAAHAAADNLTSTAQGERLAPLGPLKVINLGSNQILERGQVATQDIQGTLQQLGVPEHTIVSATQHGKYGVIPQGVVDRMNAHDTAVSARGDWKRYLQAYTQGFRHVKFATSPHHFFGIAQEQAIRLVAEQTGLLAKKTGHAFQDGLSHLAETDQHGVLADQFGPLGMKYRQLEGVLAGRGGLVAGSKENDIVRRANAWQETSSPIKGGAEMVGRSKAMKAWLVYRKATEQSLVSLEHQTRGALMGKALRDTGFIPSYRQALKMTDAGMRAHIAGKLTPNMADAIARKVDDMGGNWNHQTPAVRAAVSSVTPFGLWWLNSLRWLYRLPVTHPVKTAIAASLYDATRSSRNAEGQGYDAPGAATKKNPGYLQGSVQMTLPVFGRAHVDFGHYSPVGTLGPEAGNTAVSMIAPQLSGVLDALRGTSSLTHEKLTDAHDRELSSQPAPSILNAAVEALSGPTVGATQAQQLLQGGSKPYGTANLLTDIIAALGGPSQTKPGTEKELPEVLAKLVSPVRAYKVKGSGEAVSPSIERAIKRSEKSSAFDETRIQRALERSER